LEETRYSNKKIPLSKLSAGNVFFRDSLAENFVTYFLAVISLQKLLGKNFLFRYFLEEVSLQYFFGRGFC